MSNNAGFIRDQSDSTDDSELLHQQLSAQQPNLDHPPPSKVDEVSDLHQKSKIGSIYAPGLIYPKSRYHGYISPLPISSERQACTALLQEFNNGNATGTPLTQEDFVEFKLTEFSVYLPPDTAFYGYELRGLQDLASKISHSCFLFDGILRAGSLSYYVQGVPFKICSIGNYGEEVDDVGDAIWIQSDLNTRANIYYRLQDPAPEYTGFHLGFLWLTNLSKHFVDYSLACQEQKKKVSIHNFRADFAQRCRKVHAKSAKFQSWYLEYGRDDFRQAISASVNFLYKESVGVTGKLRSLYIWKEILDKTSIKEHPIDENMTIVTPYVYDCFSHLRFGHLLKPLVPSVFTEDKPEPEGQSPSLSPRRTRITRDAIPLVNQQRTSFSDSKHNPRVGMSQGELSKRQQMLDAIQVGDVLSVTKDGPDSLWKDETSRWKTEDHCWYIYVQIKHKSPHGKYSFDGIWLYKPSDTSCAKMKYPYPKELFLSDNCTCGSGHSRIPQDEVIDTVPVIWHGLPSETDIFIRQTYLDNENFVTLKDSHKTCEHLRMSENDSSSLSTIIDRFPIGQTILALPPRRRSNNDLEPYEIVRYDEENSKVYVTLRRLLRRSELKRTASCRPNELVYTDVIDKMLANRLERTCLVRFYTELDVLSGNVPAPYCRDGGSNAFYITKRLRGDDQNLIPIEEDTPRSLIQGFDPKAPLKGRVLNGLDLFCGGGNLGRGLEEGGAVHNKWAVDLFSAAIQTYSANTKNPEETNMFFGSVNDLLAQAFHGNPSKLKIPLPGDVDLISAGSPCQGYSIMNMFKSNDSALKNQSLVASVAAYIDFYRPKYGLLENVLNMAQKGTGREEDVLSQLICAIVGLGYQVQLFLLDSWSFGSSQARSRIFVSFAAPGCVPLKHPELSHSHPPHVGERGLGRLANGQSFGSRIHCATPYKFRTAEESVADLPFIGNGAVSHCTRYPDHVLPLSLSKSNRAQIACIPTHPRGMNFSKTWNAGNGIMTKEERDLFPYLAKSGKVRESVVPGSCAWGRIKPYGLFPTVLVCTNIEDSRMGTTLHWDQHRRLSLMELRRAQSFPDDEVLIGTRKEQIKIIGNSVDRTVSMALGISLRNAWFGCEPEDENDGTRVVNHLPMAVREKEPKSQSSAASTTVQVVLSQRLKAMPNSLEPLNDLPNGIAATASSSSNSTSTSSSLEGWTSTDSNKNPQSTISKIQKRRRSLQSPTEPARKSPRLGEAFNFPSKSKAKTREPFANSIQIPPTPSKDTSATPPASRTISLRGVANFRPRRSKPGAYSTSPAIAGGISSDLRHTSHLAKSANELSSSKSKPIVIDDSEAEAEADSEDTAGLDPDPHASTLLHRTPHLRTAMSNGEHTNGVNQSESEPESGLESSHGNVGVVIDLTKSESESESESEEMTTNSNPNASSALHSSSSSSSSVQIEIPRTKIDEHGNSSSAESSFSSNSNGNGEASSQETLGSREEGKYVPVDNSLFDAYAQTKRVMGRVDGGGGSGNGNGNGKGGVGRG